MEVEFEELSDNSGEEGTPGNDDGVDYRFPEQATGEHRWIVRSYRFDALLYVEDTIR
jgi:hypothetical protein